MFEHGEAVLVGMPDRPALEGKITGRHNGDYWWVTLGKNRHISLSVHADMIRRIEDDERIKDAAPR